MLKFLAVGEWSESQIDVEWTDRILPRNPKVEKMIDDAWAQALVRPGIHLFDGPMCRLDAWRVSGDRLRLELSPTSYKRFMGTNLVHPELADQFGPEILANPVGVSAALITTDGYLMLGRRNDRVAWYPNRVHPFAGTLDPADKLDLFAGVRRELFEELALSREDVPEIRCTGIAQDIAHRQPEIVFRAHTTRTRAQVDAKLDVVEHQASWAVRSEPDALRQAIASGESFTPVGLASMLLYGRVAFGEEWFRTNAIVTSKEG